MARPTAISGLRLNEIGELAMAVCAVAGYPETAIEQGNAPMFEPFAIGLTDSPIWTNILKITRYWL
jgi:ABC-type spermidine/putrescine transport system permease subunit I